MDPVPHLDPVPESDPVLDLDPVLEPQPELEPKPFRVGTGTAVNYYGSTTLVHKIHKSDHIFTPGGV
jgi:hypothetical protein